MKREIAIRLKAFARLKLVLLVLLNVIVFAPYHFFQQHQFFPTTVVQPSFVDRLLPFLEWSVIAYLSIYILMPIGPFLMKQRGEIVRYSVGVVSIGIVADVVFLFWPTICARPDAPGANAIYRALVQVDQPYHAFPSLHAAFAVYSALCGIRVFAEMTVKNFGRAVFSCWAVVILLATLTTRQHVFIDIVAGSILGFAAYFLVFKRRFTMEPIDGVSVLASRLDALPGSRVSSPHPADSGVQSANVSATSLPDNANHQRVNRI